MKESIYYLSIVIININYSYFMLYISFACWLYFNKGITKYSKFSACSKITLFPQIYDTYNTTTYACTSQYLIYNETQ